MSQEKGSLPVAVRSVASRGGMTTADYDRVLDKIHDASGGFTPIEKSDEGAKPDDPTEEDTDILLSNADPVTLARARCGALVSREEALGEAHKYGWV